MREAQPPQELKISVTAVLANGMQQHRHHALIIINIIVIISISSHQYPHPSAGGRVISIAGGMAGALILAVAVAVAGDAMQLSRSELKVVAFLKKHDNRRRVRDAAALSIQTLFRLHKLRTGECCTDTSRCKPSTVTAGANGCALCAH